MVSSVGWTVRCRNVGEGSNAGLNSCTRYGRLKLAAESCSAYIDCLREVDFHWRQVCWVHVGLGWGARERAEGPGRRQDGLNKGKSRGDGKLGVPGGLAGWS